MRYAGERRLFALLCSVNVQILKIMWHKFQVEVRIEAKYAFEPLEFKKHGDARTKEHHQQRSVSQNVVGDSVSQIKIKPIQESSFVSIV